MGTKKIKNECRNCEHCDRWKPKDQAASTSPSNAFVCGKWDVAVDPSWGGCDDFSAKQ